jgi:hypothetical protein
MLEILRHLDDSPVLPSLADLARGLLKETLMKGKGDVADPAGIK